jgi:1-acyl-sn-glycerol-3-phosphate acyltransferase
MTSSEGPQRLHAVRRSPFWWWLSRGAVLVFCKIWFRIRCENAGRLPTEGPVLLVANHTSYVDPGVVGITATRWVGFLAQAGLASLAPCRWWLAQVGVTLIDRDAPSKASMRLITDCLRAGEVVGIFPEGTRSKDGSIGSFKGGVEFLVRRSKATVVPIGIDGAFRAFPRKAWLPRPRKIVVRYGEPWSAEKVLSEGGIEALRRQISELSRAPLAEDLPKNREKVPSEGRQAAESTPHEGGQEASSPVSERSGKGLAAKTVDSTTSTSSSSSSASAGGGA